MPWTAHVTAFTHAGLVRHLNEDTIAVGRQVWSGSMQAPAGMMCPLEPPLLCMVADGMGGHAAGEIASRLAADRLAQAADGIADGEVLADALRRINDEMYELVGADARKAGMGTTVAGVVVGASRVHYFNVGDSRVYREQEGLLRLLSVDDVPVRLGTAGGIQRARSSIITQALGGASRREPVDPHIGSERLMSGRRFLVCSDGLTDLVDDESMEACLVDDDLESVAALAAAALGAGGDDNLSILLVRPEPPNSVRDETGSGR